MSVLVSAQGAVQDASSRQIDPDMIQTIRDAIETNVKRIRSYEAEIEIQSEEYTQTEPEVVKYRLWYESGKFRCDFESSSFFEQNGKREAITTNRSYVCDGERAVEFDSRWETAKIDVASPMMYSRFLYDNMYLAFQVDIAKHLEEALSCRLIQENSESYVELKFPAGQFSACDLTVLLAPNKGFCVIKSEIFLPDGTLAGVGETLKVEMFGKDAWVVTEKREETFRLSELRQGRRTTSMKDHSTVRILSWGRSIPKSIFDVEISPRTLVVDQIAGKEYVEGYKLAPVDPNLRFRRWAFFITANLIILSILLWRFISRKREM